MQSVTSLLLLLLSLVTVFSSPLSVETVVPQENPPPTETFIEAFTFGGSGCPAGTVAYAFSEDRQVVTLIFDEFTAQAGPTAPPAATRKFCQLNFRIHVPQGWSYSVATVDFRGFVQLDPQVTARAATTFYFSGEINQSTLTANFNPPITPGENYLKRAVLPFQQVVWSPCGANRNLNIKTDLNVDNSRNRNRQGQLTQDTLDAKVKQIYRISWRRCPTSGGPPGGP